MILRRTFLTGLLSALAAPAIVRADSLMPVKLFVPFDPLVMGARWQSWPLCTPRPDEFATGTLGPVRIAKPTSYFAAKLEPYRQIYPGLRWVPLYQEEQ